MSSPKMELWQPDESRAELSLETNGKTFILKVFSCSDTLVIKQPAEGGMEISLDEK